MPIIPPSTEIKIESSAAEPTAHLRWCNGVLQQAWVITNYRGGDPYSRGSEWRDVPTHIPGVQ